MIIVKTNTCTHFVNEKAMQKVWHDKENATVYVINLDGTVCSIYQVTSVTFVSDAQSMEFHDDGNIIEEMKAKMDQMEAEKLATILKTESECNAKIEKAEKELKEGRDLATNIRDQFLKYELENDELKKENEKLQDWVVRLKTKLRDFGCEL